MAGTGGTPPFTFSWHTESATPANPPQDEQLIVLPAGEVDLATAPLLQRALLIAVDRHPRVCCDLSKVTFFSAAGVTALLVVHNRAIQTGSRLTARRPHGITERVLHLAGLEHMQ
ncbi:STAS domain-containing protein [Plantactinospora sp. KLBMP9567]|uniref:STAS domain-containing protein n=1 Tax=Plantactinospora sp. KLBMP9567 TaxID=3085900 RepID=UPI00298152F8|nr:STAS domain-containing protein [Plantactinospora sp. KLBMP9567]MDW5328881.1 STAS domain-containing protein [Plantactinospora sp. KLBMP9567]